MTSANPEGRSWDLSLYELHRTPQEVITDDTEIAVSPKSLQSELTCPICLDMLTNTMTTKECLHRFCAECIITALRSGNKECPTCRKKLISKRSLRPDPNFDQLVAKMFPYKDDPVSESEERGENTVAAAHQRRLAISKRRVTECEVSEAREEEGDLVLQPHPRLQQELTERLEGRGTRYVKTVRAARVE